MMFPMKFTKMHGIGNDYVYVNGFAEKLVDPARVAVAVSDRHFGIGSDGLIVIEPSTRADVRMRMFKRRRQRSGDVREMVFAAWRSTPFDHGLSKNNPMKVETGRGVLSLVLHTEAGLVRQVTVNMGEPILDLPKVPVDPSKVTKGSRENEYCLSLSQSNEVLPFVFVSVGNPARDYFCG